MNRARTNKAREHRISMEILVDAYTEEEQMMGWYYYLDDVLTFPFPARCIAQRGISPLKKAEVVEVLGMARAEDCSGEMLVMIQWSGRKLSVPLSQLAPLKADRKTKRAIEDWKYWKRV